LHKLFLFFQKEFKNVLIADHVPSDRREKLSSVLFWVSMVPLFGLCYTCSNSRMAVLLKLIIKKAAVRNTYAINAKTISTERRSLLNFLF